MRSRFCSPRKRSFETIDSRSMRSRLRAESTSWSVTSIARKMVNPRMTNCSGGKASPQPDRIEQVRVQVLAHFLAQRRHAVARHHLLEAPVEEHPEVALEPGVGIGHRADQRIVDVHLDAVQPSQHQGVGVAHPHHRHHGRVEVDPRTDGARLVHQQALHERGGVKPAQLEREHGRAIFLLPGSPRKHGRHQDVHQVPVSLDHGRRPRWCRPVRARREPGPRRRVRSPPWRGPRPPRSGSRRRSAVPDSSRSGTGSRRNPPAAPSGCRRSPRAWGPPAATTFRSRAFIVVKCNRRGGL